MNHKSHDSAFDAALGRALAARSGSAGRDCPDESRVAAYLERRLEQVAAAALEEHAAKCASCQRLIALALELDETPVSAAQAAVSAAGQSGRRVLLRFSFSLSALALAVVAAGIGVVLLRGLKQRAAPAAVAQLEDRKAPPQAAPAGSSALDAAEEKAGAKASRVEADEKRPTSRFDQMRPAEGAARAVRRKEDESFRAQADREAPAPAAPAPAVQAPKAANGEIVMADKIARDEPSKGKENEVAQARVVTGTERKAGIVAGGLAGKKLEAGAAPTPRDAVRAFALLAVPKQQLSSNATQENLRLRQTSNRGPAAVQNAASQLQANSEQLPSRALGDRTLYLYMGYWIDAQAAVNPEAEIVEGSQAETAVKEIRKSLPAVKDMRAVGAVAGAAGAGGAAGAKGLAGTMLVYWSGKIYVIR
jgi:hypothetical protein